MIERKPPKPSQPRLFDEINSIAGKLVDLRGMVIAPDGLFAISGDQITTESWRLLAASWRELRDRQTRLRAAASIMLGFTPGPNGGRTA